MKQVVLSKWAVKDIDRIWNYLAFESGSVEPAERVIAELEKRIAQLARNPAIGRLCPGVDAKGRCLVCGKYLVYDRADPRRVMVTPVIHGKRDQSKTWGE